MRQLQCSLQLTQQLGQLTKRSNFFIDEQLVGEQDADDINQLDRHFGTVGDKGFALGQPLRNVVDKAAWF